MELGLEEVAVPQEKSWVSRGQVKLLGEFHQFCWNMVRQGWVWALGARFAIYIYLHDTQASFATEKYPVHANIICEFNLHSLIFKDSCLLQPQWLKLYFGGFTSCEFLNNCSIDYTRGKYCWCKSCGIGLLRVKILLAMIIFPVWSAPTNWRQAEHQHTVHNYISDTLHLAVLSLLKSEPVFTLII